jgi:pimeloyl-ACP methyl ester carboxylesterase
MSYRGYGGSSGAPSEQALLSDAVSVYDTLTGEIPHNGVVVGFGRSLGAGVAIHLAAERPVDALVLVSPFDSLRDVGRGHYPWLPVGMLLRHPFDSLARAPGLDVPAVFLVAAEDRIIPPANSRRLFDHWRGAAQWMVIDGVGHNSIAGSSDYWRTIRRFLDGV